MGNRISRKRMLAYEELADFPRRLARMESEHEEGSEHDDEWLHLVLSNAPFGVALLDAHLNILYMNEAARALLIIEGGVPSNWEALAETVTGDDTVAVVDLVRFTDREKSDQADGAFDMRLCGGVRSLEFRATRLHDGRVVVGFADATERREEENALKQSHRELEDKVRERTRELEAANNAKRDFLSNMSHELRTPLNGIIGMSDILKDTKLDQEQRLCLNAIRQSGHEMLRIVNNLLDLSKADAGRMALRPRNFALRKTLEPVIELFRRRALDKSLAFNVFVDKNVPENVHGDPERFRQVAFNLLDNAVKFTKTGRIEFVLTMGPLQEPGTVLLRLVFTDTGPGITPEQSQYIFDSFYMGEALLTKKQAGAGLGLPIARHIAVLMGGDVRYEALPNRGSLFVAEPMMKLAQGVEGETAATPQEQMGQESLRILLVEDEEVSRMYARLMLEKMGHAVSLAVNGLEALHRLAETDYDLVLMDIQMPEMDGITAVEHIRGARQGYNVRDPDIPVVAFTVFAHQDAKERILAADVDEYITKPVESSRLAEVMSSVMKKRKAR